VLALASKIVGDAISRPREVYAVLDERDDAGLAAGAARRTDAAPARRRERGVTMADERKYDVPAGDVGRPCRACGKQLHFVKTEAGKIMPVEWDGTPHWGKCARPQDFRRTPRRRMDDDA
jgi:hypothetical protein